jgi:hypothetical protein
MRAYLGADMLLGGVESELRQVEHWQHAAATCHRRQGMAMSFSLTCPRNTEVWYSLYKLMLSLVGAELALRA